MECPEFNHLESLEASMLRTNQYDHLLLGSNTPGEVFTTKEPLKVRGYTTQQLSILLDEGLIKNPQGEFFQNPLLIHTENVQIIPSQSFPSEEEEEVVFPAYARIQKLDPKGNLTRKTTSFPLDDFASHLVELASFYDLSGTTTHIPELTKHLKDPSFYLCERTQNHMAVPILVYKGREY